jgi:hypothetical protein
MRGTSLIACVVLCGGCRASASASVNTGQKQEEFADFDDPAQTPPEEPATTGADYALLGARHDLKLSPDRKTPTCACVAVALGGAGDPAMVWEGQRPEIDQQSELVIALNSEGIACDSTPKDGLGASYWGYKLSGDDVIVVLEVARFGRPITTGAVIPRPAANGQVYLQPLTRDVPYGRPLDATQKLCLIGKPAAPPSNSAGAAPRRATTLPEGNASSD